MNYLSKEQLQKIKSQFATVEYDDSQAEPALYVARSEFLDLLKSLKEKVSLSFDRLANYTAVDYKDYFEIVYNLFSRRYNRWVTVKVKLEEHDNPEIESVAGIWEGANFEERETYDLMGIRFLNHPNLTRILMPDDYDAFPLRKDFVPLEPKIEGGELVWHKPSTIS